MQIGIDQIINIGENVVVDPKKLLCSICYALNIEARECLNKKCKKLFCLNCINSLKNIKSNNSETDLNNNKKKIPCPFCRVEADFYKAEESLNKIISDLKFGCMDNCCTTKFNLEELKEHNVSRRNLKFCYKCKDSTFLNYSKCLSCNNVFCNDCDFIKNCLNCHLSICDNCISSKYKNKENFLCGECEPKCFGCEGEVNNQVNEICSICDKILCSDCIIECYDCGIYLCKNKKNCKELCKHPKKDKLEGGKCRHKISLECDICFPRCKYKLSENSSNRQIKEKIKTNRKLGCQNMNKALKRCKTCDLEICVKNCSHKCKRCKDLICENCCKLCKICKNIVCISCSTFCEECPKIYFAENQLVYCLNCEIDTIRNCQKKDCNKKLCLSCWNVCNKCDLILCSKDGHSLSCLNCEEKMCENHFHNCSSCNKDKDDLSYKKLCLKNCTNKCSFCNNTNNILCSVENHKDNYVTNLNCGHNVCRQCLRGCAKCKNIVVSCPKCIVNYYFHKCRFCEFYLCNVCSRYCKSCEDNYCPFNKCLNCNKICHDKCSNCINSKGGAPGIVSKKIRRNKCNQCLKYLDNCDICAKKFMCCEDCYFEYRKKLYKKANEPNSKNKLNLSNTCLNLNQNNDFKICEMFKCDECYSFNKKPNESDIEISPLTLRSGKDIKISIINNKDEKNSENIIKEDPKVINKPIHNEKKSEILIQNEIITNNPEITSNKIPMNPLHKNNHYILHVEINNNDNNNKNINNSDSKNKVYKENISDKRENKIKNQTKKEKVTCLSMCLLF